MGLHRERLRRRRGSAAPLTHNGRSSAPRPANQCERRRREPRAESEAGEGVNQETYGASSRKTTAAARLGRAAHAQRPKQRSQARQPMRAPKARAPSGKRSGRGRKPGNLWGFIEKDYGGGAARPRRSRTTAEAALPGPPTNASAEGASPERKAKRARD